MPRLLVRLPNWIGDTVMALPCLAALQEAGFELQLIGKGWARSLLSGLPYAVHSYPAGLKKRAGLIRQLAAGDKTCSILLMTNSLSSALEARMAGVPATGFRHEGRGLLLSRALRQDLSIHQVERFWLLAQSMAPEARHPEALVKSAPRRLYLPLTEEARQAARIRVAGLDHAYIMLCPFGAGTIKGQSKLWTGFADLIRKTREDASLARLHWLVCPGKGEVPDAALQALFDEERAMSGVTPRLHVFNDVGLPEYAALMKSAACTLANDSGPSHMAAAVDATQLTIFGPSDPADTGPWHPQASGVGGKGQWPSVDEVLSALRKALSARN